jgi:trimeric autotransporter adhesin
MAFPDKPDDTASQVGSDDIAGPWAGLLWDDWIPDLTGSWRVSEAGRAAAGLAVSDRTGAARLLSFAAESGVPALLPRPQGAQPSGPGGSFTGTAGADSMVGTRWADTMAGGGGNDTYVLNDPGDVIAESAGDGFDLVEAWRSWVLPDHVEALRLTGALAFSGSGNSGANLITGTVHANLIEGGDGNDSLGGATGDDTVRGGGGVDRINGGKGNDLLEGGDGRDTLHGLDGNDTLDGGAGPGWLIGGDGDDRLVGADHHDQLRGGAGNDTLRGWGSADVLTGGAGADLMEGGNGQDYYEGVTSADTIIEDALGGYDIVQADGSLVLAPNVEQLELYGDGATGTGTSASEYLGSHGASSTLLGLGGNDTLRGSSGGRHVLDGGSGNDALRVYFGSATVNGGTGSDSIQGYSGSFVFDCGHGNDHVYSDVLVQTPTSRTADGGDGNDTITFHASGTAPGAATGAIAGDGGNDSLAASRMTATIDGGAGSDTIIGVGQLRVTGGSGPDVFGISSQATGMMILDFEGGQGAGDVLRVDRLGNVDTVEEVMAGLVQDGADVHLYTGTILRVVLAGMTVSALVADDFLIV